MRRGWFGFLGLCVLAQGLCSGQSRASAQTATQVEVYASGLVNPKGMVFTPDGTLYVAEAGKPGQVMVPLPVNFGGTGPIGTNGRISRIPPGGQRQDFVTGLPNVGLYGGIEMLGPTGMAFLGGTLYEVAAGHITVSPVVSRVGTDGKLQQVADLGGYNRAHPASRENGDAVPLGNPFDMVALGGNLYITDGNYQRIFKVSPRWHDHHAGRFPGRPDDRRRGGGSRRQPLRRPVWRGPVHAGLEPRRSRDPGRHGHDRGREEPHYPCGCGVRQDGTMYVLQFAAQFDPARLRYVPSGGEVRQVNSDGTTRSVVSGLMFPTAMTFGPDGALYVSNYGNESNDGQGQILRVVLGNQPGAAPAVPPPDESRSYALAQPTPVGQAAVTAEVAGTVSMVEPADTTQWGFEPNALTVQVGQAIRFTNSGKIAHTATQSQGVFDTGFLKAASLPRSHSTHPGRSRSSASRTRGCRERSRYGTSRRANLAAPGGQPGRRKTSRRRQSARFRAGVFVGAIIVFLFGLLGLRHNAIETTPQPPGLERKATHHHGDHRGKSGARSPGSSRLH